VNPSFWCYLAGLVRELKSWPAGTKPSFDFTEWLIHDLLHIGISCSPGRIRKALQEDADWTQFMPFYTSLCGWGLNLITAAQRASQVKKTTLQVACKAARSVLELVEVYSAWPSVQAYCLRILQELLVNHGSNLARMLADEAQLVRQFTVCVCIQHRPRCKKPGLGFLLTWSLLTELMLKRWQD